MLWASANCRRHQPEEQDHPPQDQRKRSAYLPGLGGAALVLPRTSEARAPYLEEIASAVAPGAHAVMLLDQAGWHTSAKLPIPANINLLPLPTKSPQLNTVENLRQHMRDNRLSNRVLASYQDIPVHCGFT